ncbi:alpha/beta hydrolase [Novosphingobium profundi]|uniref:alpha/beta fold hydrolase n=1 Tax=Novosphingobium profundi TaxID=1774954 RepID=UPI001BDAB9E4|nr:alpha/beta hydrolase [Novosphingobium profundi]MBT0671725.1 alpha/beta hydrolase [Novosphingobium profundi]
MVRTVIRRLLAALLVLLVVAAGFVLAARLGAFAISLETLRTRYATPHSRYLRLDGVEVHVADEGQGPAILLIHGHYQSLRVWEEWTRDLARSHRVLRLDMPPYGLSGADPSGRYSPKRVEELIALLVRREKLTRFAIGGISTGSAIAMRYTLAHPDQVNALILANAPLVPLPPAMRPKVSAWDQFLEDDFYRPVYRPEAFYQDLFDKLVVNRAVDTRALAHETYDMLRKPGNAAALETFTHALRFEARDYGQRSQTTQEQLARVRVPTLVLWGEAGTMLPLAIGCEVARTASPGAPLLVGYAGAGHFLPLEAPRAGRDVAWFLADPQARLQGGTPPVGTREACR